MPMSALDSVRRVPAVVLATAAQAVLVLGAVLVQRPSGPVLFTDEAGYLGIAVDLSSRSADVVLPRIPTYAPGFSVLVAPLLSVSDADPWRVAVLVNIVLAVAMVPVLYAMLRRAIAVTPVTAAVAALAGAAYPGIAANVTRAWSEVLLAFLVALWGWILAEHLSRPRSATSVGLALAAVGLWTTHHRMTPMLAITAVVILASPWEHRLDPARPGIRARSAMTAVPSGLVALAIALFAARQFVESVSDRLFGFGYGPRDTSAILGRLLTVETGQAVIGHLWTIQIALIGLFVVAALVPFDRSHSPVTRTWALVSLGALAGSLITSATFISGSLRVDALVYERYMAVHFPVVVALAIAVVAASPARRWPTLQRSALATGVVMLAMTTTVGLARFTGSAVSFTIPTLAAWDVLGSERGASAVGSLDVGVITVAAIVTTSVLVAIAQRRPAFFGHAVVLVFFVLTVAGSHFVYRPLFDIYETSGVNGGELLRETETDELGVLIGRGRIEAVNSVAYRAGYPTLIYVDETTCPAQRLILAPNDFAPAYEVKRVMDLRPFGGGLYERSCEPVAQP